LQNYYILASVSALIVKRSRLFHINTDSTTITTMTTAVQLPVISDDNKRY